MRIEIEVDESSIRQADAERKDNGDDLSRDHVWLRLPDDVRVGLMKVLGRQSLDDVKACGLSQETALKVMDLYLLLH